MIYQIESAEGINIDEIEEYDRDFEDFMDRVNAVLAKINLGVFVTPDDVYYRAKLLKKVDLTERIQDEVTGCVTTCLRRVEYHWCYVALKLIPREDLKKVAFKSNTSHVGVI